VYECDFSVSDSEDNCPDDCTVVNAINDVGTDEELKNRDVGQGQDGQSTDIY
jgi:hypothetical protein